MFEVKVTIGCPDLVLAATALAKALHPATQITPDIDTGNPASMVTAQTAPASVTPPTAVPTTTTAQAPSAPVAQPQPPVTAAPTYTLDLLANAGAVLARQGKTTELQALLPKYGVASISELAPDLYGAFATDLRGLGAQI